MRWKYVFGFHKTVAIQKRDRLIGWKSVDVGWNLTALWDNGLLWRFSEVFPGIKCRLYSSNCTIPAHPRYSSFLYESLTICMRPSSPASIIISRSVPYSTAKTKEKLEPRRNNKWISGETKKKKKTTGKIARWIWTGRMVWECMSQNDRGGKGDGE